MTTLQKTLIEVLGGAAVGVVGSLLLRRRLCRAPWCYRRGRMFVVYHWPPVLGVITFESADGYVDRREYMGGSPEPTKRGPFCVSHAHAECAHWTAEFSKHGWPAVGGKTLLPHVTVEEIAR